jgi:hypothetical protein
MLTYQYGAFEADVCLSPDANGTIADWPTFRLDPIDEDTRWPAAGEIDIVEGLAGKACYCNTCTGAEVYRAAFYRAAMSIRPETAPLPRLSAVQQQVEGDQPVDVAGPDGRRGRAGHGEQDPHADAGAAGDVPAPDLFREIKSQVIRTMV